VENPVALSTTRFGVPGSYLAAGDAGRALAELDAVLARRTDIQSFPHLTRVAPLAFVSASRFFEMVRIFTATGACA